MFSIKKSPFPSGPTLQSAPLDLRDSLNILGIGLTSGLNHRASRNSDPKMRCPEQRAMVVHDITITFAVEGANTALRRVLLALLA